MRLAARGARNMDDSQEKIDDTETATQIRRRARRVYLQSTLIAAVLTVIILVIPG